MTASIGIWAQGEPTGESVLYRWEADGQTGFVTFEVSTQNIRPTDESGRPIGDLVFNPAANELTGTVADVNRPLFTQIAASIMRAYRRAGKPRKPHTPTTTDKR